jgi:hypothetical protein
MRRTWAMKCRGLLTMLPSTLLVASLAGCSIVHVSGDPSGTPPLKQAADAGAETAVGYATDPKHASSAQDASRDAGGTWHWTQVDQSGRTVSCEGPKVGVPTQCD